MHSDGYCSCHVCLSVYQSVRSMRSHFTSVSPFHEISLHEPSIAPQIIPHIQCQIKVQKVYRIFSETAAFESCGVKHEVKSQYAN